MFLRFRKFLRLPTTRHLLSFLSPTCDRKQEVIFSNLASIFFEKWDWLSDLQTCQCSGLQLRETEHAIDMSDLYFFTLYPVVWKLFVQSTSVN